MPRLIMQRPFRAMLAVILMAASSGSSSTLAAEAAELRKLFPNEADVFVTRTSRTGLVRLDLPATVLAECRPDLSDLRLFDRNGGEVPFLVDSLPPSASLESKQRYAARTIEYFREEVHRDTGPPLRRESFIVQAPGRTAKNVLWVLVVETDKPEFVSRVQVSESSGGRAVTLVDHDSLFRVQRAGEGEKTRLALPVFSAERLRVTLESEDPFWLTPSFRFESAGVLERGGRIAVPLQILSRDVEDGASVLEAARPRGIVPDLLRLTTSTDAFDRKVEVWEEGPGIPEEGRSPLAAARLFRLKTLAPVEDLEMSTLRPAQGDRLRIRIEDGDSPPLGNLAVTAVVRQPSLIFSLPTMVAEAPVATLRFGGGRADFPHYDLAGFSPSTEGGLKGAHGRATEGLYDRSGVAEGRIGEIRPNPGFDRAPALGFAMKAGREIDAGRFSHMRSLSVPGSPEGLVRVPLAPADAAVMRDDLSDLRIVNGALRQWPYLVERDTSTALVGFRVEGPTRRNRTSRYHLRPDTAPVRLDRVVLQTDTGFFDRAFSLSGTRGEGDDKPVVNGRLVRGRSESRPIVIALPPERYRAFDLDVEDGDDAPLTFTLVKGRVLLPILYLAAPAGEYTLLMGDPEQTAPRYELARVRDVVLAVRAEPAVAGDLRPNPRLSMTARLAGDGRKQQVLLWGALAAAVITLSMLTLRLVRRQTSSPG